MSASPARIDAALLEQCARSIPLLARDGTTRAFAIVDREDFEALGGFRWNLQHGYAARLVREQGRQVRIYMHRAVLGLTTGDGLEADHVNRNRLDNRRANLRTLARAENAQNVGGWKRATSRFRGVCWDRTEGNWRAYARLNYRMYNLGRFATEEQAAVAAATFRAAHMPHADEGAQA